MDSADPSEPARRETSIRGQLAELTEGQGWVHHVVDVDTGEVMTTPLDRPLGPLSRAQRLARLGHPIPLPNPWGPVYKLTARSPYQTAPLNWLSTYDAVISLPDAQDQVFWSLPEDPEPSTDPPGLRSHFDEPPAQRCVVTLVFAAASRAGAVGHIRIAGSATGRIPIAGNYAEHTVDLAFTPSPGSPVEIFAFLEPGLSLVVFYSITLQAERVILDPNQDLKHAHLRGSRRLR